MARGRRQKSGSEFEQPQLDLWGLSEAAADEKIEAARTAPPSVIEQQLFDGTLDFSALWNDEGQGDEQVR